MNFRNISSWCIRNPVGPIVLFVGLMLAGIIAFARMQVNNAPDIDFPAAIVFVTQPGAAPNEMETQVTQRVESAIRGITGVDEISSTVTEGNSTTFVQFQLGTPTDRAVNDVRNVISQIRSNLPDGFLEPQVERVDAENEPISYVGAQTTDMTLEQLSWYIDNTVAKRLLGLPGIAAVGRVGGVDRVIRVILDPAALQAQGITAAQVNQQLRQSNMNGAGGRAEIAGSEQSVRVLGNAQDAYELSQTQISLPGGRFVRLADLGEVRDSNSEQRSIAKMDGRQVVTFMIQRAKGSSEVTAYEAGWKELKKLEKENPKVRFSEVFNTVDYTKSQYRSAMEGLIEGAILAVLVVLLFLRDIRATLISALAIPLSAIPAFAFMSMLGITLNFMSTMAMGLVAGVLVDDAIVEIENIVRHMRMGKSAYQASLDAADEIGLAVLATTMAIVAVFFPVALMPGIAGQYFKAFGFTVVVSVLMSLFVARMITPLISAYFLRSRGVQPHAAWKWMDLYLKVLNWSLDTTKAHALLAKLPKPSRKFRYYAMTFLLLLPVFAAFLAGTAAPMMLLGKLGLPGAIGFGIKTTTVPNGGTRSVLIKDQPVNTTGGLIVHKVDSDGNLLPGACFQLRDQGTPIATVCDADDGANDGKTTFADITVGDYRLRETQAPSSQYLAGADTSSTIYGGVYGTIRWSRSSTRSNRARSGSPRWPRTGTTKLDGACFGLDRGSGIEYEGLRQRPRAIPTTTQRHHPELEPTCRPVLEP